MIHILFSLRLLAIIKVSVPNVVSVKSVSKQYAMSHHLWVIGSSLGPNLANADSEDTAAPRPLSAVPVKGDIGERLSLSSQCSSM